jgi:hypothetical protein
MEKFSLERRREINKEVFIECLIISFLSVSKGYLQSLISTNYFAHIVLKLSELINK